MATFKIDIQKHHLRRDGLYPVSIRVTWKQKKAYIKTEYYVSPKQIKLAGKNFQLTDNFILRELLNRIAGYEEMKSRHLGRNIELYDAKGLAEYFVKHSAGAVTNIDFIEFANTVIEATKNKGNAGLYQTIVNSIKKFIKRDVLYCSEISIKFLTNYEAWLLSNELKPSGINLYMRTFRALFNKAREHYNDEEKGDILIANYPFKKYKPPQVPETKKRALTVKQIKLIRDLKVKGRRATIAQDVFMLSFYLIGMNTVDFYFVDKVEDGRLIYNRTKTKSRRSDEALASIKIEPEALKIIEKYRDKKGIRTFDFYNQYYQARALNKVANQGLKQIAKEINKDKSEKLLPDDLEFYAARHSWATIARNDCNISKDDIHEALNHASTMKVTDIYIKKDLSIVDNANRKVLNLIKRKK